MENLDDIDRRILRSLQSDAAKSLDVLSDEVGLSRNACWRRIKVMEGNGIIRARVALIDPGVLGLGLQVYMFVRTHSHDPGWLKKFASATREMPEIQGVYRMTGELDYLVRARLVDVADYDRLYQRLIAKVPIADVSASFVMEEIKDTHALPV